MPCKAPALYLSEVQDTEKNFDSSDSSYMLVFGAYFFRSLLLKVRVFNSSYLRLA